MFGCLVEEADRGRRAYDVRFCRSLLLDSLRPLSVSSTPPKNNALDQLKLVLLRPGYLFPLEGHFDQLKLVFAPLGSATKRSSALASLLLQIPESQRSAYALRFDYHLFSKTRRKTRQKPSLRRRHVPGQALADQCHTDEALRLKCWEGCQSVWLPPLQPLNGQTSHAHFGFLLNEGLGETKQGIGLPTIAELAEASLLLRSLSQLPHGQLPLPAHVF